MGRKPGLDAGEADGAAPIVPQDIWKSGGAFWDTAGWKAAIRRKRQRERERELSFLEKSYFGVGKLVTALPRDDRKGYKGSIEKKEVD